jgi:hypothetical protein
MRRALGGFVIGAVLAGSSVAGAAVAGDDGPNDRRDAITCPKTTAEDDRYLDFRRLDDGRARIVIQCP